MSTSKSLWLGIGISRRYLEIIPAIGEDLRKITERDALDKIYVVVADSFARKFNGRMSHELVREIYKAVLSSFPSCVVKSTAYYSKQEEFGQLQASLEELYEQNQDFKKEVNGLVIQNRSRPKNISLESGYVLGELAFMQFFRKRGVDKIGPLKTELQFDKLAIRYLGIPESYFNYFKQ